MKRLRIGRRRARVERSASPLELALAPAVVDGRWQVPDRFNFTRDVVEVLAEDPKRRALTFSGQTGIIEPLTFRQVADGAARWAWILRHREVEPGDRVLVLVESSADWIQVVLGCLKAGAVTVPVPSGTSAPGLEVLLAATGASLVVADHGSDRELAQLSFEPEVQYLDEAETPDDGADVSTHDTSSRDVAFVLPSSGRNGSPRLVAHTHGATFAARLQAEHWLDATRGDAVWCTPGAGVAQRVWTGMLGPWSRGAELVLHQGEFDAQDRLDLIHRLGVSILCQTPGEYRALSELRQRDLERYRPRRIRRLVSTGDFLEPDVVTVFEEAWGMTIHDGYGRVETNVIVANGADAGFKPGSLGLSLPGHQVAVVDGQGNEVPPGIEGELAVRGRPPTLFSGYWDAPDETKAAFTGDWYRTGDVVARDDEGFFWFIGQAADVIAARGRIFGPHEVERVLREHQAVRHAAVVGVHDRQRGGHFVRAFVVLEPRKAPSEQLEAELRQHVADRLPEQQVPREVEFVAALPTTARGKIRRDELRERPVAARTVTAPAAGAGIAPDLAAAAAQSQAPEPAPAPVAPAPAPVAPEPEPVAPEPEPVAHEPVAAEPIAEPSTVEPVSPMDETFEPYDPVVAALGAIEAVTAPEPAPEPPVEHAPEVVDEVVVPVDEVVEPTAAQVEPVVEDVPPVAEAVQLGVDEVQPGVEEPEPTTSPEPAPSLTPEAAPLPDYVVEHEHEPVAPAPPLPEPEPEPVEDEPLPDYIVDPARPRPAEPEFATMQQLEPEPAAPEKPKPETEPETPLAGLGLKPITEFPRRESPAERPTPPRRRRAGRAEPQPDRTRSLGDPGDEPEEVGWMQGLSSRLSAYSLGSDLDKAAGEEPEDDEATEGREETETSA